MLGWDHMIITSMTDCDDKIIAGLEVYIGEVNSCWHNKQKFDHLTLYQLTRV